MLSGLEREWQRASGLRQSLAISAITERMPRTRPGHLFRKCYRDLPGEKTRLIDIYPP
jgi:hypothetical protein